jgi:hypothetical protein
MLAALRVGFLIGLRQIQRANIWTTSLIIFIMMLTFLNLVGVSGILVGLIEGSVKANRGECNEVECRRIEYQCVPSRAQ